ncbi:MAG: hypothetical protein IPJ69_11470 [Deltaproteobacteria bacterium]|nr:MAG: hypothetical protein IPJ69_11470 [Deltaproteobacteria bacterium]
MFVGVIKTKDVLLHPLTIISMRGVRGYLKLFLRALSPKRYRFISMTQNTQWIDTNNMPQK